MTPTNRVAFTVRLAPDTADKLAFLAEERHASRRYVIETLIREAWHKTMTQDAAVTALRELTEKPR